MSKSIEQPNSPHTPEFEKAIEIAGWPEWIERPPHCWTVDGEQLEELTRLALDFERNLWWEERYIKPSKDALIGWWGKEVVEHKYADAFMERYFRKHLEEKGVKVDPPFNPQAGDTYTAFRKSEEYEDVWVSMRIFAKTYLECQIKAVIAKDNAKDG